MKYPVAAGTYGFTLVGPGVSGSFDSAAAPVGTARWLVLTAHADGRIILRIYRAARSARPEELVVVGLDGDQQKRTIVTAVDLAKLDHKLPSAIDLPIAQHVERLLEAMSQRIAQGPQANKPRPNYAGVFPVANGPELLAQVRKIQPGAKLPAFRAPATGVISDSEHTVPPGFCALQIVDDAGLSHQIALPGIAEYFIPQDCRVTAGQQLAVPDGRTPASVRAQSWWMGHQVQFGYQQYVCGPALRLALAQAEAPTAAAIEVFDDTALGENIYNPCEGVMLDHLHRVPSVEPTAEEFRAAVRGRLGIWSPMVTDADIDVAAVAADRPLYASRMPKAFVGTFSERKHLRFRFPGGYADLSVVPRGWEKGIGGALDFGDGAPIRSKRGGRGRGSRRNRPTDSVMPVDNPAVQTVLAHAAQRGDQAAAAMVSPQVAKALATTEQEVARGLPHAGAELDRVLDRHAAEDAAFEEETVRLMESI